MADVADTAETTAAAAAAGGGVPAPGPGPGAADGAGTRSAEKVTMRVWRGDENGGEFTDYEMPAVEGEVVLDVIHRIQADPAPDLACRWNCKAGKCGSCSAEILSLIHI